MLFITLTPGDAELSSSVSIFSLYGCIGIKLALPNAKCTAFKTNENENKNSSENYYNYVFHGSPVLILVFFFNDAS